MMAVRKEALKQTKREEEETVVGIEEVGEGGVGALGRCSGIHGVEGLRAAGSRAPCRTTFGKMPSSSVQRAVDA